MKNSPFSTALSDLSTIPQGNPIRFPSPAKLNLFLYINHKRADGYHELQTLFQFLDYGDELEIAVREDGQICLTPAFADLKPEDNLIYRAAIALQQQTQTPFGATIHVDKILPMGGGVGGGSSNAATTLVALNYLWQTGLTQQQLMDIGVKLGADVPIFIAGKSAVAEGVGEKMTYCEPAEKWYLVLKPDLAISTAKVFCDPDLTRNTPKKAISQLLHDPYHNDCEKIVRNHYPIIDELIAWLLQYAPARLTGTGACVFAEFDSEQAAQAIYQLKPAQFTGFVAKGCNRSPLALLLDQLERQN
ncbi:4-(cytidine 5'-diphospho)-2-C-methyl-D-erythritol kinase [Lonepinella sp. BR2357]|uniref:4-(cytidine 5'-diphospho)-2-C-methyl-D-erythritol kinase n=1 Tax=Lonepinella sp. BR2357 TaxID=3434549 RepID=UPI003F6E13BE